MERVRSDLIEYVDSKKLEQSDRQIGLLIVAVCFALLLVSIVGTWVTPGLLPGLWSELAVPATIGLAYAMAIRRDSIDLRLGVTYIGCGVLISLPLMICGTALALLVYVFMESIGGHDSWGFIIFAGFFVGSMYLGESAGRRGASKLWRSLVGTSEIERDHILYRSAFYLVENKWADSWFFGWIFLSVEFIPTLVRYASTSYLYIGLIAGGMIVWLVRAWHILRREQDRIGFIYADDMFMQKLMEK